MITNILKPLNNQTHIYIYIYIEQKSKIDSLTFSFFHFSPLTFSSIISIF